MGPYWEAPYSWDFLSDEFGSSGMGAESVAAESVVDLVPGLPGG